MFEAVDSVTFVESEDDFSVGVGVEGDSFALELRT